MKTPRELIEHCEPFSTVMIVRKAPVVPDELVEQLTAAGVNVLGPVTRAAEALTIAGQARADLALVEAELAGRRDGHELARALREVWGVQTIVLPAS